MEDIAGKQKLKIKNRYDAEGLMYFAKRKFYTSYVGARMVHIVKIILDKMLNKISVENLKILDIGSGPGFFERILLTKISYDIGIWVSVDISESMVKAQINISPKINVIIADAEHLPFRNELFDIILISRMIKFVDPKKIIEEIKNISKGFIIQFIDVADTFWVLIMEQLFHIAVDPAVWNDFRTISSKKIDKLLSVFTSKIKIHITAFPLSFFNYFPWFFLHIGAIFDKPWLGSRIICYIIIQQHKGELTAR